MYQLNQVSLSYQNLKKFEALAPQLILSLRHFTVKIVKTLKQFQKLKNPEYTNRVRQNRGFLSEYFFELVSGQGNILDLIREGKSAKVSKEPAGSMRLQFVGFETFLMKKLAVFLNDANVLFLPKTAEEVMVSIQAVANHSQMKFNV